jgi:dihydrofolate reductase
MRKLIEATFMSLDGVIDAPKLVEEAQPYFSSDEEHATYSRKLLFAADALLLGRKTYEFFAEAYPKMASGTPGVPSDFVDRMNSIPKYVASRTLAKTKWNASVIKGDVAEEILKLKQLPGRSILKYGTGILDKELMKHNLIDYFYVYLYPFVFGHGIRFFENIEVTKHLKLVETTTFKNGTVILEYSCGT